MAAFVTVGAIAFGGVSNDVGVFTGQNMQNGWDSHSPNLSVMGVMMGNMDIEWAGLAQLNNAMPIGQPIVDSDIKNNAPMVQGP